MLLIWHFDFKHCYFPIYSKDYYFYLTNKGTGYYITEETEIASYTYSEYYKTPFDMLLNTLTYVEH